MKANTAKQHPAAFQKVSFFFVVLDPTLTRG